MIYSPCCSSLSFTFVSFKAVFYWVFKQVSVLCKLPVNCKCELFLPSFLVSFSSSTVGMTSPGHVCSTCVGQVKVNSNVHAPLPDMSSKIKHLKQMLFQSYCISLPPADTVMLAVLLLMLFSSLVASVPPPSGPPDGCRRCCDDLGPAEGSGDQPAMGEFSHVPEIRTYINMTILKGMSNSTAPLWCPASQNHKCAVFRPRWLWVDAVCVTNSFCRTILSLLKKLSRLTSASFCNKNANLEIFRISEPLGLFMEQPSLFPQIFLCVRVLTLKVKQTNNKKTKKHNPLLLV